MLPAQDFFVRCPRFFYPICESNHQNRKRNAVRTMRMYAILFAFHFVMFRFILKDFVCLFFIIFARMLFIE